MINPLTFSFISHPKQKTPFHFRKGVITSRAKENTFSIIREGNQ